MSETILEMREIVKVFDGVDVLKNISFELKKGEVHAIIGENGAGKTTLMNILAGQYKQTSGNIYINNKLVEIDSPIQAMNFGIATVYQNDDLFENMNVTENIFANREPKIHFGPFTIINWPLAYKKAKDILKILKLNVSPDTYIKYLNFAEKKFVEVARTIASNARIVIMDEPTVVFTEKETEILFSIIKNLKATGVSIIYISHRYEELFEIADRVTILRDGKTIVVLNRNEIDQSRLFRFIVGDEIKNRYPKLDISIGEEVMIVKNLATDHIRNISFSLRTGEILGIFGLKGSGKNSLAKALFGLCRLKSGSIYVRGEKANFKSSQDSSKCGIAYIPSNRFDKGIIMKTTVSNNTVITFLKDLVNYRLINNHLKTRIVLKYKKLLDIKYKHPEENIKNLSGGNQKKVMISKWLFRKSKIMIMNEPTSSMDINSKVDIYNIINEMAMSHVGIIFISSEIPELLGMCDRILIMKNGEIVKEVLTRQTKEEDILRYTSC